MKVLITGVNGFVGNSLAKYLELINGVTVWGTTRQAEVRHHYLDHKRIRSMDITVKNQVEAVLQEVKPDYIFHFAAQSSVASSWENPQNTMLINVNGTLNLLESIRKFKINSRVLLVGSSEEYGSVDLTQQPINEFEVLQPSNPYAVSKTTQNMLAQLYYKSYNIETVMVRSFNQIGPGQESKFVVSHFAKCIAEIENNANESFLKVGNLNAIRDFMDVRDAVSAYWLIMRKGKTGETYNVGSGKGYMIKEILEKLISYSKVDIKVIVDPERIRPIEVPVSICNNTKLRSGLHWEPIIDIDTSLREILSYWRKYIIEGQAK